MFNSPIGRWNNSSQLWRCVNKSHLERKKIILKQACSKLFWFRRQTPGHLPYREQDFEAGFSTASPSLFFPVHWTLQCKKLFDSFPLHKIMRKAIVVNFLNHPPLASPSDAQWVSLIPQPWPEAGGSSSGHSGQLLWLAQPHLLHETLCSFTQAKFPAQKLYQSPHKGFGRVSPGQMCKQLWFVGPILVCHPPPPCPWKWPLPRVHCAPFSGRVQIKALTRKEEPKLQITSQTQLQPLEKQNAGERERGTSGHEAARAEYLERQLFLPALSRGSW